MPGLLFRLFTRGFKNSSGTAGWYRSSSGTDVDNSEIVSPATGLQEPCLLISLSLRYVPQPRTVPQCCNYELSSTLNKDPIYDCSDMGWGGCSQLIIVLKQMEYGVYKEYIQVLSKILFYLLQDGSTWEDN